MADTDKDSKTEEPTAKRLNKAMEEGQFAQTQEIGVVLTMIAGLLVVMWHGPGLVNGVFDITISIFGNLSAISVTEDSIEHWSAQSMLALSRFSGPFLIASLVAGVIAGGMQSKFRLTPKALGVKFNKINPIPGFKKIVSKDSLVKFGIDLLKLTAVGIVLYGAFKKIVSDPIFYTTVDFSHIGAFIVGSLKFVFWRLILALIVIAVIAYIWQRKKTNDDLKMTKEEVKQERKDADANPEVKKARMQMAMRMMQGQMLEEVPTADVVVTNPTHYAVALKYERGVDEAPMVLAKGENAFAKRIKEIAKENGVPIVENKMVARMLYKVGQVGQSVPVEMYQSVAEILAFVYRTHKYYFHKLKARRAARKLNNG
ncbi:MAG: EscU/YscU/HrcU family type III secretion system export apparatus switch protein [Verrucomicrobiota bacterium]